jgi:CHASE2 domain-containing sensor protein
MRGFTSAILVMLLSVGAFQWLIGIMKKLFVEKWSIFSCPSPKFCQFFSLVLMGLAVSVVLVLVQDYPLMMDSEDSSLDFAMQAKQNDIPPAKDKQIPSFVFLDIDNQTHKLWGSPLFTPRDKVKELIDIAVKGEARLIVVDIDLSRKTPFDGLKLDKRRHKNLQLHPYDKKLYDYIADYKKDKDCETTSNCPPILLARVFQPLTDFDGPEENLLTIEELFQPDPEPIRESRISFLETAVADSAPYVQWASPLFLRSSYDNVIRRWWLWQPVCTQGKPEVIPSFQLLAATIVRDGNPEKAKESIDNALASFKPSLCGDTYIPQAISSQSIRITDGLTVSEGTRGIRQRIMYNMPWQPPQNVAEKFTVRYFLLDYDEETQDREVILTVFSAQPFLDSTKENIASAGTLKDKIVVIGGSYDDGGDIHVTPLEEMPGALIIINAIHSLLQYGELQPLTGWTKFGWTVAVIVIVSLFFTYFPQFWVTMISGILVVSLIPMAVLWLGEGIWINFAFPLLAVHIYQIASNYQRMRRETNKSSEQIHQEKSEILVKNIELSLSKQLQKIVANELPKVIDQHQKYQQQYDNVADTLKTANVPSYQTTSENVNEAGQKKSSIMDNLNKFKGLSKKTASAESKKESEPQPNQTVAENPVSSNTTTELKEDNEKKPEKN